MKHSRKWYFVLGPMILVMLIIGIGRGIAKMQIERRKTTTIGQSQNMITKGLTLKIFLTDKRYSADKMIPLYCCLCNVEKQSVILDGRMIEGAHIQMTIRTPDHKSVYWPGVLAKVPRPERRDFVTIQPGFIYGRTIAVPVKAFGNKASGKYDIEVEFEAWEKGQEYGLKTWTGDLKANTVTAEVH
jgi:hypothetical protein